MSTEVDLQGQPPLLKVPEVARLLRIGRNQCFEAIARGDIAPVLRLGRSIRVPRTTIERLIRGEKGSAE